MYKFAFFLSLFICEHVWVHHLYVSIPCFLPCILSFSHFLSSLPACPTPSAFEPLFLVPLPSLFMLSLLQPCPSIDPDQQHQQRSCLRHLHPKDGGRREERGASTASPLPLQRPAARRPELPEWRQVGRQQWSALRGKWGKSQGAGWAWSETETWQIILKLHHHLTIWFTH